MRTEISYDLVMDDDMEFVEGTYRLPGSEWQVVIFSAFERDVTAPEVIPQVWPSGVTGIFVRFPRTERINRVAVQRVLSAAVPVYRHWELRKARSGAWVDVWVALCSGKEVSYRSAGWLFRRCSPAGVCLAAEQRNDRTRSSGYVSGGTRGMACGSPPCHSRRASSRNFWPCCLHVTMMLANTL